MKIGWSPLARVRSAGAKALAFCVVAGSASFPVPAATSAVAPAAVDGTAVSAVESQETARASGFAPAEFCFEANQGQENPGVRFTARGGEFSYFLTQSEAVLLLDEPRPGEDPVNPTAVRMRFVRANPMAGIRGESQLPGKANYLRGNDASRWVSGVSRYARVRYSEIYPGIDLVFYENDGSLEYDFVVAPGADPSQIAVTFDGAGKPAVSAAGDLEIATRAGTLKQRKPVVYQVVDGQTRTLAGDFRVDAAGVVRFSLPECDTSLPIVIDPQLTYSSYLGGSSAERGNSITLDTVGNIYLAGRTFSSDYPTVGGVQIANNGNYDVLVSKFDPSGATLLYSTYIGGEEFDSGQSIAVNAMGEAFVAGYTLSGDFPLASAIQGGLASTQDAFVLKLNAAGSALLFSTYYGGNLDDNGWAIALDAGDNAWVAGRTTSTDLIPVSPIQAVYQGGAHDGFVARFTTAGAFLTATYLGGNLDDSANAIAIDPSGNVYLTGQTNSTTFPIVGGFQTLVGGGDTAFVTKIDPAFTGLVYSTYLGGSGDDFGTGIAVDATGAAYITGFTNSVNFPANPTPIQGVNRGINDAFVTKVNPAGNGRVYSTYFGGTLDDRAHAIAIDQYGSVYITGQTRSTNFPTRHAFQATNGGNGLNDLFVTKIGSTGRVLLYSSYIGGATTDVGYGVVVNPGLEVHLTGYTDSVNYPLVTPFQNFKAGTDDVVLSRTFEAGDTPGIVQPGSAGWFLRNTNSGGVADITFVFGAAPITTIPLSGDWNGDGFTTPGLYDMSNGTFFLRNFNSSGSANQTVVFGTGGAGVFPVVGDWNNDGVDTIGLFNANTGTWFLKNTSTPGAADIVFTYGAPASGFLPVTGDWNGDGFDSIGLFDPINAAWFLRDSNTSGIADNTFFYGFAGGTPVTGDWNNDGVDTIGLYQAASGGWFLRYLNAGGPADLVFVYGPAGATPVVGDWNR